MLKTRLLSAAVFIPLAVGLMALGGWVYTVAVAITLTIAGLEYVALMRKGGYRPYQRIMVFTIALIVGAQAASITQQVIGIGLAAFLMVCLAAMVSAYSKGDSVPSVNFGLTVGGTLYIGWLGAHLVALRQLPDGAYWTIIAVVGTGMGDVGAYFVGGAIGRHKMAPVVSPGKTWEGYFGGVATATVVGAALAALSAALGARLYTTDGAMIGLLCGVLSPIGDLGMSALKRMMGVKNFSNILPGHGGILDRLDSVLIGAPVSFYAILWLLTNR